MHEIVHKMRGTFIERKANIAMKVSNGNKISHCVRTDSETLLFIIGSKPRAIRSACESYVQLNRKLLAGAKTSPKWKTFR